MDPLCPICQFSIAENYHYGVQSCKSCAMVFSRYVKNKRTLLCLENPRFCNPGAGLRESCRKCRVDRCYEAGMDEHLVTVPYRGPTERPFQNDNFPLMSAICAVIHDFQAAVENRFPFTGNFRGPFSSGDEFYSFTEHAEYHRNHQSLLIEQLGQLPAFDKISHVDRTVISHYVRIPFFFLTNNWQSVKTLSKIRSNNIDFPTSNRYFPLPSVYEQLDMEGAMAYVTRSTPRLHRSTCEPIARALLEQRMLGQQHIHPAIEQKWIGDENCFCLFLLLLIVELMYDYCTPSFMKLQMFDLKTKILREFGKYYLEEWELEGGLYRVEQFLATVKITLTPFEVSRVILSELFLGAFVPPNAPPSVG
ncbi:hypothetical protein QR680_014682 [Steinernema hermaphroditum]|uniref:Nuclear receptor domain-containing protein n=1 Tax=Steinernema hermaphroditum TaxID=289476 RepID=A0AA39IC26_9BILA|nr:hypothetical protein QR680_014682 [Steinernema hermaphroditum]